MRTAVVACVAFVVVVATLLISGVLSSVVGGNQQGTVLQANFVCNAGLGPMRGQDANKGKADAGSLNQQQLTMAALIVSIGKQRNIPPLGWQVAIQAAMTESRLTNIDAGDRDSRGLFQMRPSQGWGTRAQVLDPVYAVNTFYDRLVKVQHWQVSRPGDTAQSIEASEFPSRYHQWEAMAAQLIGNLGNVTDPSGCGPSYGGLLPPQTEVARKAITFALSEMGKRYLWGGTGPDAFDCSGLMLRAFESAGLALPRVAADQFHAGGYLPVRDAQPGDLLFWASDRANPLTIHHVAMYLGGNMIVEAPQDGVPVRQRTVSWSEPELVPQAVRPGV
jgi:hypothetical protein